PYLVSQGITVEYQAVGGGSPTRLKHLARELGIEDRVKFLGPLDHDAVFSWLETVDIYAQLSRTEGLPRALVEAMSRGCACIGTEVGGIPELLEATDLVPTKDSRRFSKKV